MDRRILACLILLLPYSAFSQWQTIFKDSAHYQFNTVFFLNNDTGFVGGYDYTNPANNGVIFRTVDGGQTWDTTQVQELVLSIFFTDVSFGICGGDGGADFITTDMGNTWQKRGSSAPMSDHGFLYFLSPGNGFRTTMQSQIQHSSDSGLTWQNVFQSGGGSFFPGTCRLVFPDPQHGFLAQSRFGQPPDSITSISKTSDGGLTWNDLQIPNGFYPYSCYFFDSLSGIAAGKYGALSETTNGGITWSPVSTAGSMTLYDVAFVDDTIGYLIGGYCQYDYQGFSTGQIFQTTDRGQNWTLLPEVFFDALLKMTFPSDSIGYAVGFNGLIIKINNANTPLLTSITAPALSLVVSWYPNPATEYLYSSNREKLPIEIFNMQGARITVYSIDRSKSGTAINISNLEGGTYILRSGDAVFRLIKY